MRAASSSQSPFSTSIDSSIGEDQHVIESTLPTLLQGYSLVSKASEVAKSTHDCWTIKAIEGNSQELAMLKAVPPRQKSKPRVITDDYDLEDAPIGKGSYGSVYIAKHNLSLENYAVKVLAGIESNGGDGIISEIEIHGSLVHPNIAGFVESFHQSSGCFLVMEFCSGGELFDHILAAKQALGADGMAVLETQAAKYMKQIVDGMTYLHGQNVAHRDLKPENVLLLDNTKQGQVKIIDMGFAKRFTEGTPMETELGSCQYMAPEVFLRRYNEKCDVWSCGVITYALLSGEVPFRGNNDGEILDAVMQGAFEFPSWMESGDISAVGLSLIEEMLTLDAAVRPAFATISDHKWLTDHSYKRY